MSALSFVASHAVYRLQSKEPAANILHIRPVQKGVAIIDSIDILLLNANCKHGQQGVGRLKYRVRDGMSSASQAATRKQRTGLPQACGM